MKRGSIAFNVFAFSAVWLVVALVATAFLLSGLYARALETSLEETLQFQVESLVGLALQQGADSISGANLGDPRFARPASGWYWQVAEPDGGAAIAFSTSLLGTMLPEIVAPELGGRSVQTEADAFGTTVQIVTRRIAIDGDHYLFTVTGNLDEIRALVADFRGQTLVVLSAIGVMLAVMSALVARFALRPVIRLRRSLEDVREGEASSVDGVYPAELAPLAEEVNELLQSNARIVERARNQVGNLAHGLKTPIAVLRNEASNAKGASMADIVLAETQKMSDTVAAYLDKARLAARTAVVGRRANTVEVLERLTRVMARLHPDRDIAFDPGPAGWFRGEETDLEEMAGNLIDNACKWAREQVDIRLEAGGDVRTIALVIEDDGPGLTEAQIAQVQKRGVRLDEKMPGSGLGLDIVRELAAVYGGELQLSRAARGGLRATLVLPAARGRVE